MHTMWQMVEGPSPSGQYRDRWRAAVREAEGASSEHAREMWLLTAQAWLRLAERVERVEHRWGRAV